MSFFLIIISVWWIILGSSQLIGRSGVVDVTAVINGSIPALLIIIGSISLWIEIDEFRYRNQLKNGYKFIEPTLRDEDK